MPLPLLHGHKDTHKRSKVQREIFILSILLESRGPSLQASMFAMRWSLLLQPRMMPSEKKKQSERPSSCKINFKIQDLQTF